MIDSFKSLSWLLPREWLGAAKVEAERAVEYYSRSLGKTEQYFELGDITRKMERNR